MDTTVQSRPQRAPDFLLPDSLGEMFYLPVRLAVGGTVIVFFRGHWCPYCRRYLAKLRDIWPKLIERQSLIVAISAEPTATSRALAADLALPFPILSDIDGSVIERYGTRNGFAAVRSLMPHPSVFILDLEGSIRFRSIDRNYKKRTTMRTILSQLDELAGG